MKFCESTNLFILFLLFAILVWEYMLIKDHDGDSIFKNFALNFDVLLLKCVTSSGKVIPKYLANILWKFCRVDQHSLFVFNYLSL